MERKRVQELIKIEYRIFKY